MGFDTSILAAALLAAQAPAGAGQLSAPAPAALDAALARGDTGEATRLHRAMLAARPVENRPLRPDPALAAATGRLLLELGQTAAALEYLRTTDPAALAPGDRRAVLIAKARAEEATGNRRAALATLRAMAASPGAPGEETALGIARNLLPDDPAAALVQARPIAGSADAARRVDAELVAAQAHSLLGDRASAAAAAARAWAAAPDAPAVAVAPMRAALVRAGLAAERGDRDAMLAMLSVAGTAFFGPDRSVGSMLPVCGEGGIRPEDHVTVGVYASTPAVQHVLVLGASRPAAAAVVLDALAGRGLAAAGASLPGGMVLKLRCRTVPASSWTPPDRASDPWSHWLASRGFYVPIADEGSSEAITLLSRQIDDAARRLGEDHPQLIPLRLGLFALLEARSANEGDVELRQIEALRAKFSAAMRALGGADDLVLSEKMEAEQKRLDAIADPAPGSAASREVMLSVIANAPLDIAYGFLRGLPAGDSVPNADRIRMASALAARLQPSDPRRRALDVRLAHLHRKAGDIAAARAAVRKAGIAADTCEATDVEPVAGTIIVSSLSDEDYPQDAQRFGLPGLSQVEFDVSAAGKVSNLRMVVAAAPMLFDAIVATRVGEAQLTPAMVNGKPRACRAASQRIAWRMPDAGESEGEGAAPSLGAPEPDPG